MHAGTRLGFAAAIAGIAAPAARADFVRAPIDHQALHVQVYADADRDGRRGVGEAGVPGVVVAFGIAAFAVTDAHGDAVIDAPVNASGVVWARVPDGFEPRPAWAAWPVPVDAHAALRERPPLGTGAFAIGLVPRARPVARPVRIVVASDTHVAAAQPFAHDLDAVARDAVAMDPPPALFAILGDVTQGATREQFALVDAQLATLGVPVARVPGNHDWFDGGDAWTARYGPDNYSFDVDSVHIIVWNMALAEDDVRAFVAADLAHVDRGKLRAVIGMTHAPPSPAIVEALRALGVSALLTGHLHGNRVVAHDEHDGHDGLRELSTEPLLMGGIDGTPAGDRVVTIGSDGRVTSEDRTLGDDTAIAAARQAPPDPCAPAPAIVAADLGAAPASAAARELAPPLVPRWAANLGGHVITATPVIARGTVYVVVTDLGDGDAGGVVALDLATGAERWRHVTPVPVRGAAAVVGDAIIAARIDGTVIALDAATGAPRWQTSLADGLDARAAAIFAGPTADDGDVLVGNQRRFAALDARTGRERWAVDPMRHPDAPDWVDFAVLAPVAVARGLAIGTFAREQSGVAAFDRATGQLAWRVDEETAQPASRVPAIETLAIGIAAAPVVAGDSVYLATSADEVAALAVDTGAVRWRTRLDRRGFDWGAAIVGTPAYARGVLVVPTLYDDAVAVDAASGAVIWRHAAPAPSPLRVTHYRGSGERGYASSPVIAGDVVYLASTDGTLVALALATGAELWRTRLGAPVLAGLALAPDGATLVAADYDGTVRAFAHDATATPPRCTDSPAVAEAGGGCGNLWPAVATASALVLLTARRLRARSRSARRAPRPT